MTGQRKLVSLDQKQFCMFFEQPSGEGRTWSANLLGDAAGNLQSYPVPESDS